MGSFITEEKVLWGTRQLPHRNLKWGQSFSSGMPDSVAVTAGTSAWGASVEIIDSAEPHRDSPSPWNGSYPRAGDRITIEIWVNKERISSYNLLVDEVTYTLSGATLALITDVDKFTQTKMRLPGLLKKMPRTAAAWASDNFSFRYPAPMTMWAVSEAFRAAGYHATPPIHSSTVIDVPMQGAFWANEWRMMGDVIAVSAFDRTKPNSPTYGAGEGRLYFHDGYMMIGSQRHTTLTGNFRLSFIARKTWAGTALFKVISGFDGLSISLRIDASRNIVLAEGGPALSIPARDWADGEIVSLVVYGDRFSLAAGSREIQGTLVWGNRVTGIEIQATAGAMIAGVQVDNTSSLEHRVLGFRPTADIHPGRWTSSLEASPSIRDRTPKAVLDEIAEKTLSSWWIDGNNIAHFESAEYLLGKKPSHEVNALEHIADYVIEDSLLLKRAAVDIKYSKTAATYSHYHGVTVWAKGGTADAGSQNQEFVGPVEAEDWFDIDATFGRIADNPEGFNKRNSSWCGVSVAGATHQDATRWTDGYKLLCEEIVPWRWLITETFEKDCTRTIAEDSRINRDQWGKDSVLMRARGKVERSDVHLTIDGGPPNAPGLDIDCTGYIDRDEVARSLAQWLFDQVKDPQPVLKTLTLRYNPRIVLGDAIRVFGVFRDGSSNLFGAILICSVIAFEHNAEAATSTVTVRVTANEYRLITWDALEEKVRALGLDWNGYEAKLRQQGITWETFEKDPIAPLEREEKRKIMVSIGTWGLHVDDGKDGAYGRQQQLKSMATVDAALSRVHAISQEAAATSSELLNGVEGRLSQVSSEASRAYAAASRAENLATSAGTKLDAIEQQTTEKVEALEAKVDAATFTDAAQATDATVATFITDAQSKTSAALTTAFVQDGDGVWRADKNGFIKIAEPARNQPANAENAAKNSALWIALRNKVILAGGGIIEFGAGLYEFESMPFDIDIPGYKPKANNELNLTVQGTGGYGTLLRLTKAGYGGAGMPIGKLSYGEGSVRSVRLKDLSVVANAKWGIPDRANFQGIRVEHTSNIDFENIRVAGFGLGGFYSINAWDSSWKNVEFLYCGTANETGQPTDEAPYNAYAVELIGQGSGSTNAFHIDALRIEQAPLMLKVGPMGRLIDFSNSKFEHGHNPKSLNKTATLAPIRIDGAIEVSFTGCKFTASQSSGQQTPYKPFVQTIPLGIEDYTSRGYRSMIKFSACDFFANTATKQKWFEGSDTIFAACSFSRADGQDYPFRLKDNNVFDACTVGSVNSYIRMFTLVGKNNRIKNCSLYSGYPNGQYAAPFDVVSGATNNEVTGNIFMNQDVKWLTSESPRFLGSNRFSVPANRVTTVADGGGSDSVLGAEIVRLPAVASTQWTGFNNGWNGQRITVVARADRTELHHGNRIRNRGAVNLFLSAGDSVSYTCLDDIWYQS